MFYNEKEAQQIALICGFEIEHYKFEIERKKVDGGVLINSVISFYSSNDWNEPEAEFKCFTDREGIKKVFITLQESKKIQAKYQKAVVLIATADNQKTIQVTLLNKTKGAK